MGQTRNLFNIPLINFTIFRYHRLLLVIEPILKSCENYLQIFVNSFFTNSLVHLRYVKIRQIFDSIIKTKLELSLITYIKEPLLNDISL